MQENVSNAILFGDEQRLLGDTGLELHQFCVYLRNQKKLNSMESRNITRMM